MHPSLQSSRGSAPQTVNERIQKLRREQAPRATSEKRDKVNEVVTRRTVPPELRRILHMPEVDAPPPKPGSRSRAPRPGARPPPGLAAPSSWLNSSRHAPEWIRDLIGSGSGRGTGRTYFVARRKYMMGSTMYVGAVLWIRHSPILKTRAGVIIQGCRNA